MLKKKGIGVQASSIPCRPVRSPCEVSHAQQRLWFIDQLGQEGGAAYHVAGALKLSGQLNRRALREALDAIVRRHEVLRTRFVVFDSNPMQAISEVARFSLEDHDLSALEPSDRDAQLRNLAATEARARFDLSLGPLIRGRLVRTTDEEHVLLLTMHHIVADGWSMGVLIRELTALYSAFVDERADPLPPLSIQYADYAVWQREWLSGAAMERQLAFWTGNLSGAPSMLELPTDRPRPAVQSFRGDSVSVVLSSELTSELKTLANQQGTTMFVILHTAFAILLSRLGAGRDIVIGVPVANRQRTEIEPLIGFFVNTLALRTRLSDDATVGSVLGQIKAEMLAAHDNQDVPFEKVVEALNPPRTLSRSPVFQVMLVLQNMPRSELKLPGLTLAPMSLGSTTEKFDLTVTLNETQNGIAGTFSFATDLFDRSTIERWVDSFAAVLAQVARDIAQPIGTVSLLSESERHRVTTGFNSTATRYPPTLSHELFEQQAKRTPGAIAAVYEGQSLTYLQLDHKANKLAHYLRARGAGPDRPVGLCLDRGLDVAVAVLAVLKAGSPYLPLDPAYPRERLEYMLSDAAPGVVLAQRATLPALGETASSVLLLDEEWPSIEQQDASGLAVGDIGLNAEHLGYVIYTSGSTGRPKAVELSHGALANLMHWHLETLPPAAHVLQFASLSFDASFHEFFAAWGCGGAVVIPAQEIRYDPAALVRFMNAHAIDKAIVPVTVLHHIAELHQDSPEVLAHLRHLMATGEQLKITPAVRRLFERLPDCVLHNHYGPSETHVVTALTLTGPPRDWPDHPSIGRPIANSQIYILDAARQPVPIGVIGELFIGGAGVARGYLKRPDLTAERFLADPFNPGTRMYKTGDLARWRADGTLEFLGRNDHQVKIRGFRIELGEVEGCLSRHELVREAVVLTREDAAGEKRLVAYFTSHDESPGGDALRAHLRASLPEYMIPAAYVRLENIPLTPNGKVDRDALQRLAVVEPSARPHEEPVGEFERALAAIWQELLNVGRVSRDDNFFDLGGHSMLTAKLIARLQQLGLMASLATVFKHPTLRSLAECLEMGLDQNLVPNPILLREGQPREGQSREGSCPTIFFVHEVSGDVLPYLPLARLLPEHFRAWGLQCLGIWHLESLEQIAADQIEAMRRVQPKGPYRLAGWSLGAVIAYEMAYQLIGADETVEFLGMIDAIAPVGTSLPEMDDFEVLRQVIRDRWTATLGPAVVQELSDLNDIAKLLEICHARRYLPAHITMADIQRLLKNRRLIPEMTRRYSPAALPLKVDFFEADDELPAPFSRNWEPLIGNHVRRHVIGGTHRTITHPPHLQRLAAAMTEALESASKDAPCASEYTPLCPIQLGDAARATAFCIPGAGAGIPCFLPLAQALGGSLNVYGLQPRGLDGVRVAHSTVTAAAKFYLQAIREVCPAGPYRLLGHSFGGWVAVEMARLLREQGVEVATVFVLDSEAPRGVRRNYTRIALLTHLISAIEMGTERSLGLDAGDLEQLDNDAQLRLLRDRMVLVGAMPRDTPPVSLQSILRVFARNLNTVYGQTTVIDSDVVLFQALHPANAERARERAADVADWSKLACSLRVFEVPGNHMTMLRAPHVRRIAEAIKKIWGAP
ncbi:MAG TPA: amino acid adenylation domain-containing protein [Steroidobacteraceae bacterium]|nr:amino acid adenylation domain-containing protein [Steroidobacteraceae bacterium]